MAAGPSRPVRIVVDGTTGIEPAVRERLGIAVLPIHVANLPEEVARALAAGDRETFDAWLAAPHPAGLQPGTRAGSVWEARQVLEDLVRRFDCDIICLTASGRLSAVHDNAAQAARELGEKYQNRIAVFAEQAFLTPELLGEAAAAYALGGRDFEEVLSFVEDKRERGFLAGSIMDLSHLRRSGRVPIPRALLLAAGPCCRLFGFVPTFTLEEGRPRTTALIRKRRLARYAIEAACERVGFREPALVRVAFSGGAARDVAEKLREAVARSPELSLAGPVTLGRVSPAVAVHAGNGLVAFGVLGLGYKTLSTPVLVRILRAAQSELREFRRMLNAINVFPVRDGDTGSNLLSPLVGIDAEIAEDRAFPDALDRVAALVARRGGGYSGGALAAYLLGCSAYVRAHESGAELRLETLIGALAAGTDRAYEYFGEDAKEGTILSVMRACDRAAAGAFRTRSSLRHVLTSAWLAATDELLNPMVQQVEILRRERLADAGGLGFVLLLWAALRTLGLGRDPRLSERRRLVLRELRRHVELGGRLVYRRQPVELRGYCVEAGVRGDVAEQLRAEFAALDNRLAEAKLTLNFADGVTHFHFHVSEGLEQEVLGIAARYGFADEPRPPTRLNKRQREIVGFRLLRAFRRVAGNIAGFFVNWVAYALLYPVMSWRAWRRRRALEEEVSQLALCRLGLQALLREAGRSCLVLDVDTNVVLASGRGGRDTGRLLEDHLPAADARVLREAIAATAGGRDVFVVRLQGREAKVRPLKDDARVCGYLVSGS